MRKKSAFEILGIPVPDGMSATDDMALDNSQENEKTNEMYEVLDLYFNKRTNELDNNVSKELTEVKSKLALHETRLISCEKGIETIRSEFRGLHEEVNTVKQDLSTLRSDFTLMYNEMQDVGSELTELSGKVNKGFETVNRTVANLKGDIVKEISKLFNQNNLSQKQ